MNITDHLNQLTPTKKNLPCNREIVEWFDRQHPEFLGESGNIEPRFKKDWLQVKENSDAYHRSLVALLNFAEVVRNDHERIRARLDSVAEERIAKVRSVSDEHIERMAKQHKQAQDDSDKHLKAAVKMCGTIDLIKKTLLAMSGKAGRSKVKKDIADLIHAPELNLENYKTYLRNPA